MGPRPIGPNELSLMERAVTAMAGTGLTGAERLDAIAVLAGHARMIAEQAAATDRPEAQLSAQITTLLREHGDRSPRWPRTSPPRTPRARRSRRSVSAWTASSTACNC